MVEYHVGCGLFGTIYAGTNLVVVVPSGGLQGI